MSEKHQKDWKTVKEQSEQQEQLLDEPTTDELGALSHPTYVALEEKLTLAEQQAHENWEKSVRAMAEVDNIRRRAERDIAQAHRYSLEKFGSSLLPVVDSLEQEIQLANKDGNTGMSEGLELTMKLFLDVLKKFDIQQIDPLGEAFDPQQHEAMATQPSADMPPNSVLLVVQKGYKLNDRVIRPARVIVAKENA